MVAIHPARDDLPQRVHRARRLAVPAPTRPMPGRAPSGRVRREPAWTGPTDPGAIRPGATPCGRALRRGALYPLALVDDARLPPVLGVHSARVAFRGAGAHVSRAKAVC